MRIFTKTDIGKMRSINQDAFFAKVLSNGSAFAVVCDGMGGASAGDIASKTAVDIISQYFLNSYSPNMSSDDIAKLLNNAILSANLEIYNLSLQNEQLQGMGTTVVAVVASENETVICNIGDSRAYLLGDDIKQITRDHSVVQSLVESGKLSPEQARTHPEKNIITRALGVEDDVLIDNYCVDIDKNDIILLCTDGLSNLVDSNSLLNIVKSNDLDNITNKLIEQANSNGGKDNITVAVIAH
ncbi:MAG: Stp1/IreP family PP2C-type Ser/Thr phosphatase [Clostridia bacterium]|nr:Stp1/IreP family PP2C-type Ser/Thr phosphatase [Clostridia bacterium]